MSIDKVQQLNQQGKVMSVSVKLLVPVFIFRIRCTCAECTGSWLFVMHFYQCFSRSKKLVDFCGMQLRYAPCTGLTCGSRLWHPVLVVCVFRQLMEAEKRVERAHMESRSARAGYGAADYDSWE